MNVGIFQYEMQDESPLEKIDRLAALLNEKPQFRSSRLSRVIYIRLWHF